MYARHDIFENVGHVIIDKLTVSGTTVAGDVRLVRHFAFDILSRVGANNMLSSMAITYGMRAT